MDFLKEALELRRRAWEDIEKSPAFVAFSAADRMVNDLGGESAIAALQALMPTGTYCRQCQTWHLKKFDAARIGQKVFEKNLSVDANKQRYLVKRVRPSQADAAESVLKKVGEPLTLNHLYSLTAQSGVEIGGTDPVATFRSSLSKDDRFSSLRTGDGYYWWLRAQKVPKQWSEARGYAPNYASDQSIQEGGGR